MTCLKILGSVGQKNLFFYFLFFFFKKWLPNCFSNRFCFFYIQIKVITVQRGNSCGLWGILCSMDHKTASLSNRYLSFYGILSSKAIKTLGSEQKIRVGQVTGNHRDQGGKGNNSCVLYITLVMYQTQEFFPFLIYAWSLWRKAQRKYWLRRKIQNFSPVRTQGLRWEYVLHIPMRVVKSDWIELWWFLWTTVQRVGVWRAR